MASCPAARPAASLNALEGRDQRGRVLGQPHSLGVGDELARRGDQDSCELAAVDGYVPQKRHDHDEHGQERQKERHHRQVETFPDPVCAPVLTLGPTPLQ